MNHTNLTINETIQTIQQSQGFFNQNVVPLFSKLGDWLGSISGFTIKKSAEVGLNVGNTTAKIFALIVLLTAIYFTMKFAKNGVKIILTILWVLLGLSVILSF